MGTHAEAAMYPLSPERIARELNEVLQIDIDAVGIYAAAIDAIDEAQIRQQIELFKGDHERHVGELTALIRRQGGEPGRRADLAGMARRAMTRVAGLGGIEMVLRSLLSSEKLTNDVYAKHAALPLPADVLDLLRRNYGDEQRHYSWIDAALRQRLWERPTAPTSP
jgi:rubrerythrin